MKRVSENFKQKAENPFGARYYTKIVVDGNVLTDDIEEFKYSAMCNPDGDFSFGNTCSASVTFSITNPSRNLSGKEIKVYQGLDMSGGVEELLLGVFTVTKLTEDKGKVSYECFDRMVSKMEMPYVCGLTENITDVGILSEICVQTGIELTNRAELTAHVISSAPVGYTRREVISYMAQLQGKNAIINAEGNLELIWYTQSEFVVDDEKIYLDRMDEIKDESDYTLEYLKCSVALPDASETMELSTGSGTVGICFENPFMTQEILDEVFSRIGGFSFRALEVEFLGDFRLEVGDMVTVSTNGTAYEVPIMQLEHSSDGGVVTRIQSVAESDEENQINTKGPATKQMERYHADLVLMNQALANKLSADEADVRYLKADEVDALKLEVEEAIIDNIESDYAKIEALQATNAQVAELEVKALTADSTEIQNLEAGVADINELMFGAAGGSSIQTEFSNAVVAQVGEAMIDSAMIKSVSASQITAGEINTNNVCVKSEDGRLVLSDETLQISDKNRVRVQIGKDTENDYSINIWDEEGKLMFSKGGITDKAIKGAIIRNDMIAGDADISAGKLNIDSLFSVINEEGNPTIKAASVYFDDKKQTLQVRFNDMTSELNDLDVKVTDFSVSLGEITSRISEQETKLENLSTQFSEIDQTVDSINVTVGEHRTILDDVGTRMDNAEASIKLQKEEIDLKVSKGNVISEINMSPEEATIQASKINLVGAVTFESLDSATQAIINDAVAKVDVMYALGTSTTTAPTTGWSTTAPTWVSGKYMWQKTVTTYADGTEKESAVTCISGATGAKGEKGDKGNDGINGTDGVDGIGISSIIEQYYLSSSSTSQTGGTWSTTCPAWKSGYYIWTRSYITWSDGTKTNTTPVLANGLNTANTNANTAKTNASSAVSKANSALSTANTANVNANSANSLLASWCSDNDKTLIDGGKIYAKSITADQIDIKDLSAFEATIGGWGITEEGLNKIGQAFILPTAEDIEKARDYALGENELTEEQIKAFDLTADGDCTMEDYIGWLAILLGELTLENYPKYNPIMSNVYMEINPNDVEKTIRLYGRNSFGSEVESFYGINSSKTQTVTATGGYFGKVKAGEITTNAGADLDELNTAFFVRAQSRDNLTIGASKSDYFNFYNLPSIEGYTRTIHSVNVVNATSNGTGSSYIMVYGVNRLSDCSQVILRNWASSTAVVKIEVIMMYCRDRFVENVS